MVPTGNGLGSTQPADRVGSHFQRYMRTCSSIPGWGWFGEQSIALWDCLLCYQLDQRICGHFFEIGVQRGRSAALAAMHASPEELLVMVDDVSMSHARQNLVKIKPSNLICLKTRSQDLHRHQIVEELA